MTFGAGRQSLRLHRGVLGWLACLLTSFAILGAVLFARGFLKVRSLIDVKNDCRTLPIRPLFLPSGTPRARGDQRGDEEDNSTCWLYVARQKFIIIVIDALRVDFVLPTASTKEGPSAPAWNNKLKVLHELALSEPESSKLLRFIADPPTATTQRVSGIAAGTLPAFVEVASSFSEASLSSDNFVHQFLTTPTGKYSRFDFYGDDTWLHLFPIIQKESKGAIAGFHSFHLFDLDTVDNGIKSKLWPTMQSGNFDVILAHFLGLDHCGHKYGPMQQVCGEKLSEMDGVVERVIASLDDETTLFVMGDHGMTDSGDHGGISEKEVSTILFSYRKGVKGAAEGNYDTLFWKDFLARSDMARGRILDVEETPFFHSTHSSSALSGTVTQVDLTPTISLLAGLPIPFGNVGCVIPEMLIDYSIYHQEESKTCGQGTICSASVRETARLTARLVNMKFLLEAVRMNAHQVSHFLRASSRGGQSGFATKDISHLFELLSRADNGIAQTVLEMPQLINEELGGMSDEQLEEASLRLSQSYSAYQAFLIDSMGHCRHVWADFDVKSMAAGLAIGVASVVLAIGCIAWRRRRLSSWIPLALSLAYTGTLGSTSFITFEDLEVRFLLSSLIAWQVIWSFYSQGSSTTQIMRGGAMLIFIRLATVFGACREEQYPHCQAVSHRSMPFTLSGKSTLVLLLGAAGVIWTLWQCRQAIGAARRSRAAAGSGYLVYGMMIALVLLSWIEGWISDTSDAKRAGESGTLDSIWDSLVDIALPRLLFALCGLAVVAFRRHDTLFLVAVAVLAGVVLRPFAGWALLVYGLGLLQLGSSLFSLSEDISAGVFFFYLAGMHLYFVTGHQHTLTSLQWEAAFIGMQSTVQWISAILMLLNTFSGPILSTVAFCIFAKRNSARSQDATLMLLLHSVVQLIASAGFSAVLMRHLMVWKMFTPRFILQGGVTLVMLAVVALMRLTDAPRKERHLWRGKLEGALLRPAEGDQDFVEHLQGCAST